MRYESGHKERTRERLLASAAKAIRYEGPERFGVAAVMRDAGLTHGGFYAHFASKDDLLSQAVGHMFETSYREFFASTVSVEPRKALERLIRFYLSVRHCNAGEGFCPIPILAGEQHRLPPAAREAVVRGIDRFTKTVATLAARAGVENASKVASSVVSEMIGAVALARVYADDDKAAKLLVATKRSVEEKLQLGAS